MNIGTVNNASTNNTSYISKSNNYEKAINALEKQKSLINDQINNMKNSNADQRTKEETIKELQLQISTIDTQICSIKSEEMSHKEEIEKVKYNKNDIKQDNNIKSENTKGTENLKNLTDVLSSVSDISKMYNLKNHIKSQIKSLNYEMSTKSGPTPYKIAQVGKLSENIAKIDNQIDKKYKFIKYKTNKASADADKKVNEEESHKKDNKKKVEKVSEMVNIALKQRTQISDLV